MQKIDVPGEWEWAAERITKEKRRRILALGAVDTGKSTFCLYLCQFLLAAGLKVAMVDSDIGQKDIGPPACISLGYPSAARLLDGLRPSSYYFVGAVTPARHFLPMLVGTRQMADLARAAHTLINTTGLIHGIGRALKSFKIEALRPDAIVAIQRGYELESLLKPYRYLEILRIPPSPAARPKTPEQRRLAREKAFARYFQHGVELTLPTGRIIFQRSLLFTGKRLECHGLTYCEKTSEGILGIAEDFSEASRDIRLLPARFEEGLLCGTATRRNIGTGLAIIRRIDFHARAITLFTPVAAEQIGILQLGDIYLSPNGHELDRKRLPEL